MKMMPSSIFYKIKNFDAYPKTLEDFRVKTYGGAIVTIFSGFLMAILFISEFSEYLRTDIDEELFVDTSRGAKLQINIDIVFHRIPCPLLSIDAMDVSGAQQLNVKHNVYKRRLNMDGDPIDEAEKGELGESPSSHSPEVPTQTTEMVDCGSCYGAELKPGQCCNSCEEVREAYRHKGWALNNFDEIVQCKHEGWSKMLQTQMNEGCQVFGYIEVNRVAGNFHIAPGRSFQQHHVHVHDLQPYASSQFNLTHTLKHLSFGSKIPGKTNNPLDGTHSVANEGAMMFQYYVKIVPTTYVTADGQTLATNQFSVTRHQKSTDALGDQGMPGVFLIYELSPMMVKYTERQKAFLHFLTGVCAIVGGIFTVAGLIDTLIYHSACAIQKKIELGKAN